MVIYYCFSTKNVAIRVKNWIFGVLLKPYFFKKQNSATFILKFFWDEQVTVTCSAQKKLMLNFICFLKYSLYYFSYPGFNLQNQSPVIMHECGSFFSFSSAALFQWNFCSTLFFHFFLVHCSIQSPPNKVLRWAIFTKGGIQQLRGQNLSIVWPLPPAWSVFIPWAWTKADIWHPPPLILST